MITKAMLKRASNELKQAFCALDKDVQEAIIDNCDYAQCVQSKFDIYGWGKVGQLKNEIRAYNGAIWRLSPDTPTEAEYDDVPVNIGNGGMYVVDVPEYGTTNLSNAVNSTRFVLITYSKDNAETLRTSVDAAFGTPVRVRFAKEETK